MLCTKNHSIQGLFGNKNITCHYDDSISAKGCILYFHGGGLLYGSRDDLPHYHINSFTQSGYIILSYDYPLSPAAGLEQIVDDICQSINHYIDNPGFFFSEKLPFFLWGRSAGAYLCLIAATSGLLKQAPKGILSYYGYGFLCDHWFQEPSNYYKTLPAVSESCLEAISKEIHYEGELDTHYSIYVYARQTGKWKDLIYNGRDKYFYANYTLRLRGHLPCPLFCTHSINDTDVPYSEFLQLTQKYPCEKLIAPLTAHDFDRDTDNPTTHLLIKKTIEFLNKH